MDVKIVELEALRVAADEVLIIRLNPSPTDDAFGFQEALSDALADVGLAGRSLVIRADMEMAVMRPDGSVVAVPKGPGT